MRFFTPMELEFLSAWRNLPTSDRGKFDYLRFYGAIDRATRNAFPDQFAEPDTQELKRFRIGAMCCLMTDWQADEWNSGNATAATMDGAFVFVPSRVGSHSSIRDGEVVVEDGLPTGDFVNLWWFIHEHAEDYRKFMEDEEAVIQ